jgi:DNA modification methylase
MQINKVYVGNNLDVLKTFKDNSVDSIVTDPPYGLGKEPKAEEVLKDWLEHGYHEIKGKGFMGKEWDAFVPQPILWKECLRVLKPGGHLLSFAGTRTYDWVVMGLRLAGFEIRDQIAWLYGSGFPKSHDISKAIDKKGGNPLIVDEISKAIKKARVDRKLTFKYCDEKYCNGSTNWSWYEGRKGLARVPDVKTFKNICKDFEELSIYLDDIQELEREVIGSKTSGIANKDDKNRHTVGGSKAIKVDITTANSDNAKQWQGWGTALKPALEPIVMARKPLEGTVANNVLKHGVGGINIDGCRVEFVNEEDKGNPYRFQTNNGSGNHGVFNASKDVTSVVGEKGRWPANVIHDGSDEVVSKFPNTTSGGGIKTNGDSITGVTNFNASKNYSGLNYEQDSGSASRFFYTAKSSQSERNFGLSGFDDGVVNDGRKVDSDRPYLRNTTNRKNIHPTVKPIDLMKYLVRLVTPKGGICLDPYLGSGTTAIACKSEKINYIGIELEPEYAKIAEARIKAETVQYDIFDFLGDE